MSAGKANSAVSGTMLVDGATVLVGSGARANVVLNGSCVIPLAANQHLTLDSKLTCSQQSAAVTQLMTPYRLAQAPGAAAAAGGGAAAGVGGSLIIGGAILAVGVVAVDSVDAVPVSGR